MSGGTAFRRFVLDLLPPRVRLWVRERGSRLRGKGWDYEAERFDAEQIAAGAYKHCLGGGAKEWDRRGRYQLELLRHFGLSAASRLLDVGCGPLRAGVHAIALLAPGAYAGIDVNPDFVAAAERTVEDAGLTDRRPTLVHDTDFHFARAVPGGNVDLVVAFSVLNHCSPTQRRTFFQRLATDLQPGVRAVVTHAPWFDDDYLYGLPVHVERRLTTAADLPAALAPTAWGWATDEGVLPIVVLATD